ncbi:MAG: hypothetical protein AB1585_05410 [Thermodesulfobacteriota bacterium]
MRLTHKTITLQQAICAVRSYNQGIYGKSGRKNLDIDNEGISIFEQGLSKDDDKLTMQIGWVGRDYGGTAHSIASKQLPPRIAKAILNEFEEYHKRIIQRLPLTQLGMPDSEISYFYKPFQQTLTTEKRTFKNWIVWGTKVWHFLNPKAFQIMDSRAKRFYQVSASSDPVSMYADLQRKTRDLLLSHEDWLPELRAADNGNAWSDLKLWDKVAYEVGNLGVKS